MNEKINLTLKIWRQKNSNEPGHFKTYPLNDLDNAMSFLEMLDVLNENLSKKAKSRLRLITIAGKGYAGRAARLSTAKRTGLWRQRPSANCICGILRVTMSSLLNLGVLRVFPSLKTWWLTVLLLTG